MFPAILPVPRRLPEYINRVIHNHASAENEDLILSAISVPGWNIFNLKGHISRRVCYIFHAAFLAEEYLNSVKEKPHIFIHCEGQETAYAKFCNGIVLPFVRQPNEGAPPRSEYRPLPRR